MDEQNLNELELTLLENINSLSYPIKIKNIPFKIKDFVYSNEPEFFSSINSQQINLSFKDFDGKDFMNNISENTNIDDKLLNKYAPKVVEGTKRLKAWVES